MFIAATRLLDPDTIKHINHRINIVASRENRRSSKQTLRTLCKQSDRIVQTYSAPNRRRLMRRPFTASVRNYFRRNPFVGAEFGRCARPRNIGKQRPKEEAVDGGNCQRRVRQTGEWDNGAASHRWRVYVGVYHRNSSVHRHDKMKEVKEGEVRACVGLVDGEGLAVARRALQLTLSKLKAGWQAFVRAIGTEATRVCFESVSIISWIRAHSNE